MYARGIVLLLALASLLLTPGQGRAQCESWVRGPMDDGSLPNGANDEISATITWDPDGAGPLQERLVVGGEFTSIGGVAALHIAQYDPATGQWQPFGAGIGSEVLSLAIFNGQLVAGCSGDNDVGTFDSTVRRWNGSAWESLSATNTGSVYDLEVYNGTLYIAGSFMTHFTVPLSNPAFYVARWNAAQSLWEPLESANFSTQTGARAYALATYNGSLYAGGYINNGIAHLARFDGATWSVVTNGVDTGGIYDMNVFAGELLLAGSLGNILGATNVNNIAAWNGVSAHGFGTGVTSPASDPRAVWKITIHNGIVISGQFQLAGAVTVNNVAFWPPGGSAWQPLGSGVNSIAWDVCSFRSELIAVGAFTEASFVPANRIARWNGVQWSSFGGGIANWILSFVPYNGRIVAGGYFTQPTANLGTAFNIAGWNGGTMTSFGSGVNGQVVAMESFKYSGINGSNELIAGGSFTVAGGVNASRIARWIERPNIAFPPPAWEPMGLGFNSTVYAVERGNGVTYAGGVFTKSGATTVNYVARWNETTDVWESMFGGMNTNGFVYALKYFNGQLYAGGSFTSAGGSSTGGLARWNGSSWTQVGGFFLGTVYALEEHNGSLYIGGVFPGLANGANIARYDGVNYYNVGSGGANGAVTEFVSAGSRLYVGGGFTSIGGVAADRVAYWDGSWHSMAIGVDNGVSGLGLWQNEVHVGGSFGGASGGTPQSPRWARWTQTGLPFFTLNPYPWSQTVSMGSTATFSTSVGGGFSNLTYQWFHNNQALTDGLQADGSIVTGAYSEAVTISNIVHSDQGTYRVEISNACGTVSSANGTLSLDATAAPLEPLGNAFHAIGPNPSSGRTMMAFSLGQDTGVRYVVYDLRGRQLRSVDVGTLPSGHHQAYWDGRDQSGGRVAAGVYFLSLELDGSRLGAKRLTILR